MRVMEEGREAQMRWFGKSGRRMGWMRCWLSPGMVRSAMAVRPCGLGGGMRIC